jgi:CheY-like chemotaxis protein
VASPQRLLIADPDPSTRLEYRAAFDRRQYDIVEAADGRLALATALTRAPALLLTEIGLPIIDGISLCEILRRDRVTATVPILVVTSESRAADLTRARNAGANVILRKPVTSEMVLREALRLLNPRIGVLKRMSIWSRRQAAAVIGESAERISRTKSLSGKAAHYRTTSPPLPPPPLSCPTCDETLTYVESYISGPTDTTLEQWDHFVCGRCADGYQYRHRTNRARCVG